MHREFVALVQVSCVWQRSITVQLGQLSATPCSSQEPVSQVSHCEVVRLAQVSGVTQRSISAHGVQVSNEP